MNIRQLEAFNAVIETGSVTLAGARLGITQPAVSKLLKSLAENCGFRLFFRSGGQMLPTAEARILTTEVERLFAGTDRIRRLAESVRDQKWGAVSITAPPALATHFLGVSLAPFLSRQNDIQVTLTSNISPRVVDLVESQQVDIGLSTLPFEHPNVRCEPIMRFAMVCALPPGHPLAQRDVVHIEDLRKERMISQARADCMLMTIERAFQQGGVARSPYIEVPMSETACDFVARGAGVAVIPPFVGMQYSDEELARRPILPEISTKFWLLMSAARAPSMAAERVAEAIRNALRPYDLDSFQTEAA